MRLAVTLVAAWSIAALLSAIVGGLFVEVYNEEWDTAYAWWIARNALWAAVIGGVLATGLFLLVIKAIRPLSRA
jgi:MFS family permease